MQEKKVYFLTPYKSRDLPGNALVGCVLEKKYGLKVEYLNGYNVYNKIRKHKPVAIIFDHMVWKFKAEQLKYAKAMGLKTFVLPTEGLAWNEQGIIKRLGLDHGIEDHLDYQFSWGTNVQEVIEKHQFLSKTKCLVTGSPRFDFYAQNFRVLLDTKAEFIKKNNLKENAPIILWATNTITAGSDFAIKSSREKYSKNGNYTPQQVEELILDQNLQFNDQFEIFEKLVKNNPNWNFIIKVHPAEQVAPYELLSNSYKNVFLLYNIPIFDVLVHADILFQRNCTTATEAWILNKPVIQSEYSSYPKTAQKEFLSCSNIVRDYDSTIETINYYLNGGIIPPDQIENRERFINSFYYKVDGLSHLRVAKIIGEEINLLNDDDVVRIRQNINLDEKKYLEHQDKKVLNRIKDFFGIQRSFSFRIWKKKRPADKTEGEVEATSLEVSALYLKFENLN